MVAMNVNEFIQNCRPQYTKAKHGLKIIQEPKTIRRDDYKRRWWWHIQSYDEAVRRERMGHEQQYTSI